MIQTEVPMDAVLKAAELAKEYHVTTVLKPSACSYLPDELYSHIDLLVPNLDELNEICPGSQSMEEKADILLTKGIKTVIVTLGADGCYIRNADTACYLPAIDVVSTDSSGAGDAFICTLVSYLLYDYDLISASKIASYAAGFSTTRQGTTTALVDKYLSLIHIWDDADADLLYEFIQTYQIETSCIRRSKNCRTGQAYIFVQEDGNSMISILSGANNIVTAEDIGLSCSAVFASTYKGCFYLISLNKFI